MQERYKKIEVNVDFGKIILPIIAIVVFVYTPKYDKLATAYLDNSLKESIVIYGSIRALNGGISVIQESNINLGVGIGADVAIGQILDPINDTVERFSDMLNISLWILATEKVVYELSKMPIMIYIIIGLVILSLLSKGESINKLLILFIVVRLFVPFSAVVSGYAYDKLFKDKIEVNLKILKTAQSLNTNKYLSLQNKDNSLFNQFSSIADSANEFKESVKYYIQNGGKIVEAVIDLSMLYFSKFVLNLIILPMILFFIAKGIFA